MDSESSEVSLSPSIWPPEYPHSPSGLSPDLESQYGTNETMIPRSLVAKRTVDEGLESQPKKQKMETLDPSEKERLLRERIQEKMKQLKDDNTGGRSEVASEDGEIQNTVNNAPSERPRASQPDVAPLLAKISEEKKKLTEEIAQVKAKEMAADRDKEAAPDKPSAPEESESVMQPQAQAELQPSTELEDQPRETPAEEATVSILAAAKSAIRKDIDLTVLAQENRGCRTVYKTYEKLGDIAEGAYGKVARAKSLDTGEVVALKRVKIEKEREGAPITSIREVKLLMGLQHPNIVNVKEVVLGGKNNMHTFIVMEYVENDINGLMEHLKKKNKSFTLAEVKGFTQQLLSGLFYLHDNWIVHRDLKTPNLLYSNTGVLKIADFGLAREYGDPLRAYTPLVCTLYYRPPELLLGASQYSTAIDMWSAGCIFGELLLMAVLWKGQGEIDQINKIFATLGSPNAQIWPAYPELPIVKKTSFTPRPYSKLKEKFREKLSERGLDLMQGLLTYDPDRRLTAEKALNHSWFSESPLAPSPEWMPTYQDYRIRDKK